MKMDRTQRAKQFAPFDALKGLQEALRLVEYEHERVEKGLVSEEQAEKLSTNIQKLKKDTVVKVEYFYDGYYKDYKGKLKIDVYEQKVTLGKLVIPLGDLVDLEIVED